MAEHDPLSTVDLHEAVRGVGLVAADATTVKAFSASAAP
jgi:hypothetical protein